jgi:hypothetical protein
VHFTGAGAQTQLGVIASTLTPAIAALAGAFTVHASGVLAAAASTPLMSGVGEHAQSGSVASTLQVVSADLAGAQVQAGILGAFLSQCLFAANAAQAQSGVMAPIAQSALAMLAGALEPRGTIAGALVSALFTGEGFYLTPAWRTVVVPDDPRVVVVPRGDRSRLVPV